MLLVLALGVTLTGCKEEDTFKVYTGTFNYTATSSIGAVNAGQYSAKEISQTQFEWEVVNNYKNSPKELTEKEFKKYLTDLGVQSADASKLFDYHKAGKHYHLGLRKTATPNVMSTFLF